MLTDYRTIKPDDHVVGWVCDDRFFQNKSRALLYASEYSKTVRYYYNDHVFEHWNWGIEPLESLDQLYRQRAQQLRDTYDYIVLMFSGGSDSTNMLLAFLDNHIPVDEVISWGAWNHVIGPMDPLNIEITVAAAPLISEIQKAQIRFTHLNLFDARERAFQHSEWMFDSDPSLCLYTDFINHSLYNLPWIRASAEQGKKICYVWGCEKPKIIVKNGWFHLAFCDQLMSTNFYTGASKHGLAQEFFYSNVACTNLITKQTHVILKHLESRLTPRATINFLMQSDNPTRFEWYNDWLYPKWDNTTFSLGKHNVNQRSAKWISFERHMHTYGHFTTWQGGIKDLLDSIDAQFLNRDQNYFGRFYKIYPIKPVLCMTD